MVDNESLIVKGKDSLRHKSTWSNLEAWNTLNKLNINTIHGDDFRIFLREHGYTANSVELDRLLGRFPKRDITYHELTEELDSRWR